MSGVFKWNHTISKTTVGAGPTRPTERWSHWMKIERKISGIWGKSGEFVATTVPGFVTIASAFVTRDSAIWQSDQLGANP